MELDEREAISQVIESLATAFPSLPRSWVGDCVERVLSRYAGATVRRFIPTLVARDARTELVVLQVSGEVSGVAGGYDGGGDGRPARLPDEGVLAHLG